MSGDEARLVGKLPDSARGRIPIVAAEIAGETAGSSALELRTRLAVAIVGSPGLEARRWLAGAAAGGESLAGGSEPVATIVAMCAFVTGTGPVPVTAGIWALEVGVRAGGAGAAGAIIVLPLLPLLS
jgi:hypothetical protein